MSGVEAVLGVASAAVGFASLSIQLIDSAQKLKSFCDAVNDAPEKFHDIHYSLRTLAQTLELLAVSNNHTRDSNAAQTLLDRCVAQCRASAGRISLTVEKIGFCMMRHRKLGRLYMAFKDHEIEKLFVILQRDKNDLQLAAFTFQASEQQTQIEQLHSIIVHSSALTIQHLGNMDAKLASTTTNQINHVTAFQPTPCEVKLYPTKRHQKNQGSRWKFHIPTGWLSRKVFEVSLHQTQCGWDWQILTYNRRDPNSPIFEACRYGDIAEMRTLIQNGKASLLDYYDREYGPSANLLVAAAESGELSVIDWLFDQGLPSILPAGATLDALNAMCYHYNGPQAYAIYSRFLRNPQTLDLDLSDSVSKIMSQGAWFYWAPSRECRLQAIQSMTSPLSAYSLLTRLTLLFHTIFFIHIIVDPTSFPLNYEDYIEHEELERAIDDEKVHWSLLAITCQMCFRKVHFPLKIRAFWRDLALRVLKQHQQAWERVLPSLNQPLCHILWDMPVLGWGPRAIPPWKVVSGLDDWIGLIREAGINVQEYIRLENERIVGSISIGHGSFFPDNLAPCAIRYDLQYGTCNLWIGRGPRKLIVYNLLSTPGNFKPHPPLLPRQSLWPPSEEEIQQGRWQFSEVTITPPEPFSIHDEESWQRTLFSRKYDSGIYQEGSQDMLSLGHVGHCIQEQQDDHGIFIRILSRSKKSTQPRKRSASAPRPWSIHDRYHAYSRDDDESCFYQPVFFYRHPDLGNLRFTQQQATKYDIRRIYYEEHDEDVMEKYLKRPLGKPCDCSICRSRRHDY